MILEQPFEAYKSNLLVSQIQLIKNIDDYVKFALVSIETSSEFKTMWDSLRRIKKSQAGVK